MCPNYAGGIANSVDPDKTAPVVWSGSALFAQTYLYESVGSLQYLFLIIHAVSPELHFVFG